MSRRNQSGVRHFQVLHRSLRDPRSYDPETGDRILSEVVRKGKGRAVEESIEDLDLRDIDDAADYGIFFDDQSEYDYMQHLRPVGADREAVFVEAPASSSARSSRRTTDIDVKLPEDVLPAREGEERAYAELLGIPERPYGLQPDMNPRLRETLEALEDEAFVDSELASDDKAEVDFFGDLLAGGEAEVDDDEWEDEPVNASAAYADTERIKAVAEARKHALDASELGSDDEADTVRDLPTGRQIRSGAPSRATGYSMSSSSLFRTEGLKTLDDRFDRIEQEYADSDEENESEEEEDHSPGPIERADLDAIMDDFLAHHEILGSKLRPVLEGQDALGKLSVVRQAILAQSDVEGDAELDAELSRAAKARIVAIADRMAVADAEGIEPEIPDRVVVDLPDPNRWDCETVLSTYSNLDNHPKLLRVARSVKASKASRIAIDSKTGFPAVDEEQEVESDSDSELAPVVATIKRDKNESTEARKDRKKAAQAQKQQRREERRVRKADFGNERSRQRRAADVDRATVPAVRLT